MDFLDLLPPIYDGNTTMEELQIIINEEATELYDDFGKMMNECFASTSSSLLSRYEKIFGLEVISSKSDTFRRERIKAKAIGIGTVTKQMIVDTAAAYSKGEVEVTEEPSNHSFNIKFVGMLGIPENMSDLISTIEQIKPAHLTYTFEYTWITWNQFEGYGKTCGEWDAMNLTWDEFEIYKEVS